MRTSGTNEGDGSVTLKMHSSTSSMVVTEATSGELIISAAISTANEDETDTDTHSSSVSPSAEEQANLSITEKPLSGNATTHDQGQESNAQVEDNSVAPQANNAAMISGVIIGAVVFIIVVVVVAILVWRMKKGKKHDAKVTPFAAESSDRSKELNGNECLEIDTRAQKNQLLNSNNSMKDELFRNVSLQPIHM